MINKFLLYPPIMLSLFFYVICNMSIIDSCTKSVFIVCTFYYVFNNFLWTLFKKIPFLNDIIPPNINGKWNGFIFSSYTKREKKVNFTIKQTFSSCKISIDTNEITSDSLCANWIKEGDTFYLIYNYRTSLKNLGNSSTNPSQYGTAKIALNGDKIEGDYWTSRNTVGTINLTKTTN